jgi:hypothetical protein
LIVPFYFRFEVENPKGQYKGQKPIKLVRINATASARNIRAGVAEIIPVK